MNHRTWKQDIEYGFGIVQRPIQWTRYVM